MKLRLFALFFVLIIVSSVRAQNTTIPCKQQLIQGFISDGQQYRGKIVDGEIAKFKVVFMGGCIYRIVFCNDCVNNKINYIIRDSNRKIIFLSEKQNFPEYWDFQFSESITCTIEAEIPGKNDSNCNVYLLIGYKYQTNE